MYQNYRLCGEHFEKSQFKVGARPMLIQSAIPTIFNVPNPPKRIELKRKMVERHPLPDVKRKKVTPMQHILESPPREQAARTKREPDTPRKSILKKKIRQLQVKSWRQAQKMNKLKHSTPKQRYQNMLEGIKEHLPTASAEFIVCQIRMARRSPKGYRWPKRAKLLALSIFYHSQSAYEILSQVFKLPSKRCLQMMLQKTQVRTGFNDSIFDALSAKVKTFCENDKTCVVAFDEMSIKASLSYNFESDFVEGFEKIDDETSTLPATHVLVFIVRGLYVKWKQALGYFLTSGPITGTKLQMLVRACIGKLQNSGLHVKGLICDQGSNNLSFIETLEKVTPEKPFIHVNGERVLVFFDPPHLLKNIRNNFMKHGFTLHGRQIKWRHVVEFYEFDSKCSVRMAPKLTDYHINLRPFTNMKVNLAAQVLSHSVAAGISFLVQCDKMDKEALETAKFIDWFDKLFNCFNSVCKYSPQPYRDAISNESTHVKFLSECAIQLNGLRLGNNKIVPCIRG